MDQQRSPVGVLLTRVCVWRRLSHAFECHGSSPGLRNQAGTVKIRKSQQGCEIGGERKFSNKQIPGEKESFIGGRSRHSKGKRVVLTHSVRKDEQESGRL